MKLPFPKWILNVPVKVFATYTNEDSEPVEDLIFDGLASFGEKSRQVLDAEQRLVLLSGKVVLEGDILPGRLIEGLVEIDGVKKTIFRAARPRNPDGTVFSTELDLT